MAEGAPLSAGFGPRMICPHSTELPLGMTEENARKQDLLGIRHPLTQRQEQIYRAAECILNWETYNDEPRYLTVPAIQRCTGINKNQVQEELTYLVARELLVAQDQLQTPIIDSYPPRFYFPVMQEGGSSFFTPRSKPGCSNTLVEYTLDRLKHTQLKVVEYLAHRFADEGEDYIVTQKEVVEFLSEWLAPSNGVKIIEKVFRVLCKGDILRITSPGRRNMPATYKSSDRGVWFLNKIPSGTEPTQHALRRDLSQEPPREARKAIHAPRRTNIEKTVAAEAKEISFIDLDTELIKKLRELYPEELHDIVLATIVRHLNLGVLEGGLSRNAKGHQLTESKPLGFHPDVMLHLDRKRAALIAYYLRLDLLLYGYVLPDSAVKTNDRIFRQDIFTAICRSSLL